MRLVKRSRGFLLVWIAFYAGNLGQAFARERGRIAGARIAGAMTASLPSRWIHADELYQTLIDDPYVDMRNAPSEGSVQAQQDLDALIGPVVPIGPGSFVSGVHQALGNLPEKDIFKTDLAPAALEVNRKFWMQMQVVTQGQYESLMGAQSLTELKNYVVRSGFRLKDWVHPRLPMVRLTRAEEDAYIERLNAVVQEQLALAFPDRAGTLRFRKPTDAERLFVTSAPISRDQEVWEELRIEGRYFHVNASPTLFPVRLPRRKDQVRGPYRVDSKELALNSRGLQGLAGHLWEVTSTVDVSAPVSPYGGVAFLARGGTYFNSPVLCRSEARTFVRAKVRSEFVALRLAMETAP